MLEPVDVVIIGAGASGGAVAWSLAETKMRIVCLEQGDWVKPTDYPSIGHRISLEIWRQIFSKSIETRQNDASRYGDNGDYIHGERIAAEEQLLVQVQRALGRR